MWLYAIMCPIKMLCFLVFLLYLSSQTLALPTLLYGSEICTIKQCDKSRLRTAEMKYFRQTAGYTLPNHKRNEEILEELHVAPLEAKLCIYKHKWFQHVHRMEDNRLPKQLNYRPKGRRRSGRPLKRLLDDMTADTETGHRGLNSWWNMMMMMMIFPRIRMCRPIVWYEEM
jgi:hypothetical protein